MGTTVAESNNQLCFWKADITIIEISQKIWKANHTETSQSKLFCKLNEVISDLCFFVGSIDHKLVKQAFEIYSRADI